MTAGTAPPPRWRRMTVGLLCAALFFAAAVGSQLGADRARSRDRGSAILYLPNEKLLNHATAGLNTIVADFLWLHCIQYIGTEVRGARDFRWLETMVFTTVRLDPHFTGAFRYGSMFLAALQADAAASIQLLQKGIPQNPRAWELPYEMGMDYLMNRRNEPDARRYAAYYLGMSAATGRAPEFVSITASTLQHECNLDAVEEDMWRQMLASPDKVMRELAERKLREIQIHQVLEVLDKAAEKYHESTGNWPETPRDLLEAGIIRNMPPEPFGGHYFFSKEGKALDSSLLDDEKSVARGIIEQAIKTYQERNGHWPADLDKLVASHLLTDIPANPYPGEAWKYNPATGSLE